MLSKYIPRHLLAPEGAPVSAPAAPAPAAPAPAAPAAPAPSSAELGTPVPESRSGSASLVDEMDALIAKGPEAPKPTERGPDGKFLKPGEAAKPAAPKPPAAPAKPPADPNATKDPVALRKHLSELEKQLAQTKAEKETELTKLNAKISELEKRRFLTPEQETQQQAMESRAKQLEADLAARDYRQSAEYKREYSDKWQARWRAASQEVSELTVGDENEQRPATKQDFESVRLAGSYVQQRTMARQLFGDNWDVVMRNLDELRRIETSAAEAVVSKQQSYEADRATHATTYKSRYDEVNTNLSQKYPKFFGEDPEFPEAAAEMKKGLDFIDRALEESGTATPQKRAEANATIRMWAGAFPRMVFMAKKNEELIASLKEQIAKYQGSDPGSPEGGSGGAGGESAAPKGVEEMAAEFDKLGT